MDLGRPGVVSLNVVVGCMHYVPGFIFNCSCSYPSDDVYALNYLKRGKYYVKLKPVFAYYKEPCTNQMEGVSSYYLDIPEFRIDFEMK